LEAHLKDTLSVDSEKDETITFLAQLITAFPNCATEALSVSKITEKLFDKEERSVLRDFVPESLTGQKGTVALKLGRWLKNASTRRWENIELEAVYDNHDKVWKYRIGIGIKKRPNKASAGLYEEDDEVV
jgi:hypothetical protein